MPLLVPRGEPIDQHDHPEQTASVAAKMRMD